MPPRIARFLGTSLVILGLATVAPAEISDKIRREITASFPKFTPPPSDQPPSSPVGTPAPLSDDPSVMLPAYHIREKKLPNSDPDAWLSHRAIERKALDEYRDTMTDFEWALNCWYIPFLTPSPQARANARYAGKKIMDEQQRLSRVAEAISRMDPVEAQKLLRDLDLSKHPGK